MPLPNFLIIGAAKSGTTSLYHYLRQHPDVFMPEVKEPGFFAFKGQEMTFAGPEGRVANEEGLPYNQFDAYESLFDELDDETAVGEASVVYLYSERAPRLIHEHVPDARLIAVLRNPVERAYSHYLMERGRDQEPLSFEDALAREPERIEQGYGIEWRYQSFGMYCDQIKRYLDYFPRRQMRIFLFRDLKNRPREVVRDIYSFLDVDPTFFPDTEQQHNVSSVPQSQTLYRLIHSDSFISSTAKRILPDSVRTALRSFIRSANATRPEMSASTYRTLQSKYQGQIDCLEDLLDLDLGHWRSSP